MPKPIAFAVNGQMQSLDNDDGTPLLAVLRALGVRLRDLPLTRERLIAAILA